jgi:DNA-directed RNA polymerase specialized sigma24 family protein
MANATVQEIIATYAALTSDELVALRRAANRHLGGTKFTEPFDLIHEAIGLLLSEVRHWPTHVEFSRFMYATMRSIACAQRRRKENRLDSGRSVEQMIEDGDLVGVHTLSVEYGLIAEEPGRMALAAADAALVALCGDPVAQRVLESIMAGLEPREACANYDMALAEYRAARKRAIERVKKCFADEAGLT